MLHLIINESGNPEHRWSIDPIKDFAGLVVKGPALKKQDGTPADSAVLSMSAGNVIIDPVKQAAADALLAKEISDKQARKIAIELAVTNLKKFDKAIFKDKDTADVFENLLILLGIK